MKYIRITKPVGFLRFEPIYIIDRTRVECFKRHGDKGRYVNGTLETEENLEKWLKCNKTSILKEANTIEELCDEFVCIRKRDKKHYNTEDKKIFDYWYSDKDVVNCDFYGAIWTDKGLIYVAKMNEKGTLELI